MIELSFPVVSDQIDVFDEQLLELGDARWMLLQDLPTAQTRLIGVFADADAADAAWASLRALVQGVTLPEQPQQRVLADEDWRDSYKAHFKSWQFGSLHWVPVWERDQHQTAPDDKVIWLDPGLAFGTGNHETTRLCCERLVQLADVFPRGSAVIDAGCGSGILALSAARLGFSSVTGFDLDPEAITVSRENAALNELTSAVDFFVGDLVSGFTGRRGSIVLANIQADVLMRYADELVGAVVNPGALVLGGILAREIDAVRQHFEARTPGWRTDSRVMNEWADLLLVRR
jgi:ribosomal protein L11 methyltransferase